MTQKAKKRVEATKTKVWAIKVEVALIGTQVIEEYNKSADFKDEAGEATYDALQKDFVERKKMVTKAFPRLDLTDIIAIEPEQQEEGEEDETRADYGR